MTTLSRGLRPVYLAMRSLSLHAHGPKFLFLFFFCWCFPADLLQGIPVGLSFGSIPFLLKSRLSYSQIAIFSLSSWPYSLKLLWSPVVDSAYWPNIGRRKSWIVPIQILTGFLFLWLGSNIDEWMAAVRYDMTHCMSEHDKERWLMKSY